MREKSEVKLMAACRFHHQPWSWRCVQLSHQLPRFFSLASPQFLQSEALTQKFKPRFRGRRRCYSPFLTLLFTAHTLKFLVHPTQQSLRGYLVLGHPLSARSFCIVRRS